MVLDTSTLIALLLGEPKAPRLATAVQGSPARYVSMASVLETSLVMQARVGEQGDLEVDALVRDLELDVVPVDADQLRLARDAAARFGKGGHPAGLNYGDLFSYALAASLGQPLLCTGGDFAQTDIALAAY
jgi:ribonuclease VapC